MSGHRRKAYYLRLNKWPLLVFAVPLLIHGTGKILNCERLIHSSKFASMVGSIPAIPSASLESVSRNATAPKKAILLSSQCSGSTWVIDVLGNQPLVNFKSEMLIKYSLMPEETWSNTSWSSYRRDLETALAGADELTGFKLMYDQIPSHLYREFARYLVVKGVHVIHLRRRAAVLQLVSHFQKVSRLQSNRGPAHFQNASLLPSTPYPKIQLTPKILSRVAKIEEVQRKMSSYLSVAGAFPFYEVWYEDLSGAFGDRHFSALLSYLGVRGSATKDESTFLKGGEHLCESRVEGLDGPDYSILNGTYSKEACAMLHSSEHRHLEESESSRSAGEEYMEGFFPHDERRNQLHP